MARHAEFALGTQPHGYPSQNHPPPWPYPLTRPPTYEWQYCSPASFPQKLAALSASLARVVVPTEEEAEVDEFPADGVRTALPDGRGVGAHWD